MINMHFAPALVETVFDADRPPSLPCCAAGNLHLEVSKPIIFTPINRLRIDCDLRFMDFSPVRNAQPSLSPSPPQARKFGHEPLMERG
jgi:hypothetical protein